MEQCSGGFPEQDLISYRLWFFHRRFFVRFLLFIQKFQYTNKRTALLRMASVVARGLANFNIYDWRMHSQ